jgi:hydrogenase/urease accessory protein HupE
MRVGVDGLPQTPVLESLEPRFEKILGSGEEFIASVVATLSAPRAPLSDGLLFSYDAYSDFPGSRVLVTVTAGEASRTFVRNGPDPLEVRLSSLNPSAWRTVGEFLAWGMHHIFVGFDHIAFLLALLLGASKVGEMVKIVTSFTVAHSLTLLLAALKVVHLQPRITEALIAASIVYVAVENYFVKDAAYRWVLTFGFGLVHGLGFSEVLRERLGEVRSIALPVVSFNIGVELGQLAILAVAFPLLGAIRRGERSRLWSLRLGSAALLLLGLGWLVERIFQVEFMPL